MRLTAVLLLALPFSLYAEPTWRPSNQDKEAPAPLVAEVQKALPDKALAPVQATRRVLIFSATQGYRHKSIPLGKVALEKMGGSTGAYEAVISDDPAHFEMEALKKIDAVILLNPTGDFFMPNQKQLKSFTDAELNELQSRHDRLVKNLIQYVEEGGGLVGIHSATDACYEIEAYGKMTGAFFDGHPWTANTQVTIIVEDPENALNKPVFGDVKDFSFREEIYQFKPDPYSREHLRILLHLDPARSEEAKGAKRQDNDYAVAWIQSFGKGRVFYSSLGHNEHIFTNPMILKHFLAGIQFATGDLPADTTPSGQLQRN